ncbi:STAS domain-containing protein [Nocardiopsis coralliicola]
MPTLKIITREHDDGCVLALSGEIDMATEQRFHREVREAVETRPHGRVVLDCTQLSFIDSSGLRVLIQAHKLAKEHYTAVLIAAPNDRVAQLLRVTAIDTRIPVLPGVAAALAAPVDPRS